MGLDINANAPGNAVAYKAEAGETIASIALRFYGSPLAAFPLAQMNAKGVHDPLAVDEVINLPPKVIAFDSFLAAIAINLIVYWLVGVDVTKAPTHFAPGEELWKNGDPNDTEPGEKCTIKYVVVDPNKRITSATLEVVRKSDTADILARIDLTADEFAEGEHEYEWDGRCTEGSLANTFVHALHSPYLVRIVASTVLGQTSGQTEVAVKLKEIRIERAAYLSDGTTPTAGSDADYQAKLVDLGFHVGGIDGKIGEKSKRAIKLFQHEYPGLRSTGLLDKYVKAYLDQTAPAGTNTAHYQFILNYLGYRAGPIDGLIGKKTRRAVERYRSDRGLGAGSTLDAATKASLDGEVLPALNRYEVLEGDLTVANLDENDFPVVGAEKKVFIDCSSCLCPGNLPYNQKYGKENKTLVRPHFAVRIRPLLEKNDGTSVFSKDGVGAVRINFTVDVTAPPANLGVPNATARAYVQNAMSLDGHEADTGHHAHRDRGGVRGDADCGVFLRGKSLKPYEVIQDGLVHYCRCSTDDGVAKGTAGAFFISSTIAGDRFSLLATVDDENFDQPPAPKIDVQTGTMIVWRRYRVSKLWLMGYVPRPHRTETSAALGLTNWYDPAFCEFVEPQVPNPIMVVPRNADRQMIDLPLYRTLIREAGYRPAHLTDAQIQTRYNNNILWPLTPASVYNPADEQGYYDNIDAEIMAFEERFGTTLREHSYLESPPGLVCLVFDENAPQAGTFGVHAMVNPALRSWSWSLLATKAVLHLIHDQDTNPTAVAGGAIDGETLAHEFGHALWLHHASTTAGLNPIPADMPEHNPAEYQTCTMSYVSLALFCGKCLLKLRGWDEQKV